MFQSRLDNQMVSQAGNLIERVKEEVSNDMIWLQVVYFHMPYGDVWLLDRFVALFNVLDQIRFDNRRCLG